jgi:hypothetical protein
VNKRVGSLVAVALGFWAAMFFPARYFGGTEAVVYSLVALTLSAVPAVLVLSWTGRDRAPSPQQTIKVIFAGTGLRMVVVLGGGLLLYFLLPYFQQTSFWLWLMVFYLFMLTVEVVWLRGVQAARDSR